MRTVPFDPLLDEVDDDETVRRILRGRPTGFTWPPNTPIPLKIRLRFWFVQACWPLTRRLVWA